mmetsp:Transcript_45770/g.49427  ORF Transcript_45770/g.49427 Transcript_45770/m.49427 type:complete len:290 (-) Transcript_45770:147-1016(-)
MLTKQLYIAVQYFYITNLLIMEEDYQAIYIPTATTRSDYVTKTIVGELTDTNKLEMDEMNSTKSIVSKWGDCKPPPQFLNLRTTNAGPGIPSIESSDVASTSNLQMRPRKQPNTASDKISSDTTISKSSASIPEKRSDESLLIEAYAEAIKSSHGCQQALQTTQEQDKIDVSCLDRYHNSFVLSQQWANPSQGKDQERPCPCCDPTQQHKPEEPLLFDFPLDGMTFEDFETLAPFHGTSDMCGTVSDPSDGSEGPSTDDLDHTMLEESCKGKRKKLMSTPTDSEFRTLH